jgi:hypothetical protein
MATDEDGRAANVDEGNLLSPGVVMPAAAPVVPTAPVPDDAAFCFSIVQSNV